MIEKENLLKISETLYNLSTGGIHCGTFYDGFEVLNIKEVVFGGYHPLDAPVVKTVVDESGNHKVKSIDNFSQSVKSFLHDLHERLEPPVIKTTVGETGNHKVKTIDNFSQSVNSFLHDLLECLEKED